MRKRAFTLIELLVVIAIIAILAAILFPVFAQAKVAAKKTTSLSNTKQHALSIAMYSNDNDDMAPMHAYNQPGSAFPNDSFYWPRVVQPYVKTWNLFRDPNQSVNPFGIWGSAAYGWYYNYMRWPDYGFNATYLNNDPDCSHWQPNGYGLPVSMTAPANPAETVLLATVKTVGGSGGYYTSQVVGAPASILIDDACDWSNGGWGDGSFGDTSGLYPGNPTYTGTYAINYTGGGNVGFVDGHAAFYKPGKLAAGTDWHVGVKNDAIHLTDRSQYIWDLK